MASSGLRATVDHDSGCALYRGRSSCEYPCQCTAAKIATVGDLRTGPVSPPSKVTTTTVISRIAVAHEALLSAKARAPLSRLWLVYRRQQVWRRIAPTLAQDNPDKLTLVASWGLRAILDHDSGCALYRGRSSCEYPCQCIAAKIATFQRI